MQNIKFIAQRKCVKKSGSFRTRFDRELVGFDCSWAEILADVFSHGREQTISIRLQPGQGKQIKVNSVKKSAGELSQVVNAVLFCPDDLNMIKEGAAVRRRLMDNAISQIRPRYAQYLTEFNRLYEHKTRILKDWREKPSLLDALDEFSDGMCRASAQLIRYRASFVQRLREAAAPIHREFSGKGEELEMEYSTVERLVESTDYYAMFTKEYQLMVVDKAQFDEQSERAFLQEIEGHMPSIRRINAAKKAGKAEKCNK